MNETMMTLVGNVVDAPDLRRTPNGHSVASFRVASTQRRFDRERNEWADGDKLFVTVTVWRGLAENVAKSLDRGMPVIVYGRYYQREFVQNEQSRITYELDATSVGPDLSRGTTQWTKVVRSVTPSFSVDESGAPADVSGEYIDRADDRAPSGVDPVTGEVRDLVSA